MTVDEVGRAALELGPDERAALAAELLASLEAQDTSDDGVDRAWTDEISRRANEVEDGRAAGEPYEVIRDRVRAALAR